MSFLMFTPVPLEQIYAEDVRLMEQTGLMQPMKTTSPAVAVHGGPGRSSH